MGIILNIVKFQPVKYILGKAGALSFKENQYEIECFIFYSLVRRCHTSSISKRFFQIILTSVIVNLFFAISLANVYSRFCIAHLTVFFSCLHKTEAMLFYLCKASSLWRGARGTPPSRLSSFQRTKVVLTTLRRYQGDRY